MDTLKRVLAILLVLVVMAGLFPVAVWDFLAIEPKAASNAHTDGTILVQQGSGGDLLLSWNNFATGAENRDYYSNCNVYLQADIILPEGVENLTMFRGNLYGNGFRFIVENDNSYFKNVGDGYHSGLISHLNGGTIQDVIVELGPNVTDFYAHSSMIRDGKPYYNSDAVRRAGLLVGKADGSSVIEKCALVGYESLTYFNHIALASGGYEVKTGSLIGNVYSNSIVRECYSDVGVRTGSYAATLAKYFVGGLAGNVEGSVEDCVYRGGFIETCIMAAFRPVLTLFPDAVNVGGAAGQIIGNGKVTGCHITWTDIEIKEFWADPVNWVYSQASVGAVAGYVAVSSDRVKNNYTGIYCRMGAFTFNGLLTGQNDVLVRDYSSTGGSMDYWNTQGSSTYINTLTGQYSTAISGAKNLDWLLALSKPVPIEDTMPEGYAFNTTGGELTLTINPPTVSFSPGRPDPKKSNWMITKVSIPTMGQMPTPRGISFTQEAEAVIESVEVAAKGGTGTVYTEGVTYAFTAKVNGNNVTDFSPADVTFKYTYNDATKTVIPGSGTGNTVSIPYGSGEKGLVVTASYGGVTSDPLVLPTALPLEITGITGTKAGQVVAAEAIVRGDSSFIGRGISWSIGATTTTVATVDANGVITILPGALKNSLFSLTATVTLDGGQTVKSSKTFTVSETIETITVTPAAPNGTAENVPAGSTVKLVISGTTTAPITWSAGATVVPGTNNKQATCVAPLDVTATENRTPTSREFTFTITSASTTVPSSANITPVETPNQISEAADIVNNAGGAAVLSFFEPDVVDSVPDVSQYQYYQGDKGYVIKDTDWINWNGQRVPLDDATTMVSVRIKGDDSLTQAASGEVRCERDSTTEPWGPVTGADDGAEYRGLEFTKEQVLGVDGKFNVDDYLKDRSTEDRTEYSRAAGPVQVTFRLQYSPYSRSSSERFITAFLVDYIGAGATSPPVVSPGSDGRFDPEVGVTITAADDAVIYYTLTPDHAFTPPKTSPATPNINDVYDELANPPSGRTHIYSPDDYIGFASGITEFTIQAIAKEPDKLASSVVTVTYTYEQNVDRPEGPVLKIGDSKLDFVEGSKTLYEPGTVLHFEREGFDPANAGRSYIRYSLTDIAPSTSYGVTYDPNNPPRLPDNKSSQRVQAIFYDELTGLVSDPPLNVEVWIMQRLLGPVGYSLEGTENTDVRLGQRIYLTLGTDTIGMLDSTNGTYGQITASENQLELDINAYEVQGLDPDKITFTGDEPVAGLRYVTYTTTGEDAAEFPLMRYSTTGSTASGSNSYQYATRTIHEVYEVDPVTEARTLTGVTVHYTNSTIIEVDGTAGTNFVIFAKVAETATTSESAEVELTYSIRKAVATPSAYPVTSNDNPSQQMVGDRIHLSSDNNAEIYYTIDGFEPRVVFCKTIDDDPRPVDQRDPESDYPKWVPTNSSTLKFEEAGITITTDERVLFTINAKAVHPTDAMEGSPVVSIKYGVQPLTPAISPKSRPVTAEDNPTGLSYGALVYLTSATTNNRIFYTLNGQNPDVSGYLAYEKALAAYVLNPTGTAPEPPENTFLYDSKVGIPMTATKQNPLFEITAIATENSDPPKSSPSSPVVFTYRLQQVATPVSTPLTSSDSVATVIPGTPIQLATTTRDATIYWAVGGTTPSIIPSNRYDSNVGITMPEDITTFFTISAIAVAEGYDNSDPVILSFQPPAPVQAVLANPTAGQVTSGTKVTLTTTTKDAVIYYTTDGSEPIPYESQVYNEKNPPVVDKKMTLSAIAVAEGVKSALAEYDYTIAKQLSAPTASLPNGSVVYKGTRIRLTGTGTIAYTTDGTDPQAILESTDDEENESKIFYGNSVVIDVDYGESLTIRAYSYKSGNTPSETASFTYTVCEKEEYLSASPESDTVVKPGSTVSLSTSITGAKIFYSYGDTIPNVRNVYSDNNTSNVYDPQWDTDSYSGDTASFYEWTTGADTYQGNNITIDGAPGATVTIRAIAVADGAEGGVARVFHYKINERTPKPTPTIPDGAITLNNASVGLQGRGTIYYTTNGAPPTADNGMVYSSPIRISRSMSIRAIAVEAGLEPSEIATYNYTRADDTPPPDFSIDTGEYELETLVEFTHPYGVDHKDLTIYYTTNGSDPTPDSGTVYNANVPIKLMRPVTIKAMAVFPGLQNSVVISNNYTVIERKPEDTSTEDESGFTPPPTDSLVSRREFDKFGGPKYSDVVLHTGDYKAMVGGLGDTLNKGASLFILEIDSHDAVNQQLSNETAIFVCELYMEYGGVRVQPQGEIEIGLEIPESHRNGIVSVVRISNEGILDENISVRRSDNRCYFSASDLNGKFAIIAPKPEAEQRNYTGLIAGLVAAGLVGIGAAALILIGRRRRRASQ